MCRVRRINDAAVWRQCQPARHYYHGTLCVCVYDDNVSMDRLAICVTKKRRVNAGTSSGVLQHIRLSCKAKYKLAISNAYS